ncbi:MAG: DUF4349 domain-containing protein [Chloroflexi bacterium]|nr:DUF4349 domain-containing protein [Chloroflexota bacterium]
MDLKRVALVILTVLAVLLTACAPSRAVAPPSEKAGDAGRSGPAVVGAPAQPPRAPAPAAGTAPAAAPIAPQPGADRQLEDFDRKIIYQTQMVMTVKSVGDAITGVTNVAQRYGGYVLNLSSRWDGDNQFASATIRVPSGDFQAALGDLRRLAVKVDQENTSSQDVTEEYVDLQSRLRNLEATEAQFLELLRRAQSIDDILKIQQRLTEVRGQIEQIKGRLNFIQKRADLATIGIELRPEALAKPIDTRPGWDVVKVVVRAWEASMVFLRGVLEVVLTAVVFFWWLIPFAMLGVWFFLSRRRRARVEAR